MTLLESLLWPLTLPYGAATHLRARAYRTGLLRPKRLDGVVISVGNLTAGGTGKTPMVLWIAQRLVAEGKKAGILTRGYHGHESPGGRTSDEVELLRARLGDRVLFGVGADRFARGRELSQRGVDWFILDDGLQHLQLARGVDIVLIDATNPFGGGHLLPAGRLREPRSALGRANMIVITRSDYAPALEAVIRRETDAPIFYARTVLDSIDLLSGSAPAGSDARDRKLFAACGIGNPKAFVEDLANWGLSVVGHAFFADHHRFSSTDIEMIEQKAKTAGAVALACTEKDLFNLTGVTPAMDLFVCRISLRIAKEDEFWATLMQIAEIRRQPGAHVQR